MSKFVRADRPDHPNRCQGVGGFGQCPFLAVQNPDGSFQKYCPRHGFNGGEKATELKSINLYRAARWQSEIKEQANHPELKSLRNEVGILRVIMQEKLEFCKDANDLLMMSSTLSELVDKIARTLTQCHKIEKDLGVLLDKSQALKLASYMVETIGQYVDDPVILEMIGESLIDQVDRVVNEGPTTLK